MNTSEKMESATDGVTLETVEGEAPVGSPPANAEKIGEWQNEEGSGDVVRDPETGQSWEVK